MATRLRGRLPPLLREALAELMATFILVVFLGYLWDTGGLVENKSIRNILAKMNLRADFPGYQTFGVASIAQMVLSRGKSGSFFSINFSWGIGVTLGLYWGGGISGAHMNPAITLAFAVAQRLDWIKVPVYWLAQLLGAFIASAAVYGIYYDALNAFDGGVRQTIGVNATAGIWATYPQSFLSTGNGFCDQLFGTALLVSCIFAIIDKNNNCTDQGVVPIMIGLVVVVIASTFGFNCGCPINPARDLGPRLFIAMAGWGSEVFTAYHGWTWVPIIACLLGGVLGAILYIITIELHHPSSDDVDKTYLPLSGDCSKEEEPLLSS